MNATCNKCHDEVDLKMPLICLPCYQQIVAEVVAQDYGRQLDRGYHDSIDKQISALFTAITPTIHNTFAYKLVKRLDEIERKAKITDKQIDVLAADLRVRNPHAMPDNVKANTEPAAPPVPSSSDRLADEILTLDGTKDWPRLRELVLDAEDFDFTPDKSALLAPRLLDLAIRHRDSSNPKDAPAVWSAIRTGASMFYPNEASPLLPLLEPGHPIDTSKVACKMLGRIFEAFGKPVPPIDWLRWKQPAAPPIEVEMRLQQLIAALSKHFGVEIPTKWKSETIDSHCTPPASGEDADAG